MAAVNELAKRRNKNVLIRMQYAFLPIDATKSYILGLYATVKKKKTARSLFKYFLKFLKNKARPS